ncbi:MAG: DUF6308 family protein [Acidimicrobiales bacterium]
MPGIEVRLPGGTWSTVSVKDVKNDLTNSLDLVNRYDLIETPIRRMQILDLAIPAFLEAPPNFKGMLEELNGMGENPTLAVALAKITTALRALPSATDIWDWPDSPANRAALRLAFSRCRYHSYAHALITKMLHLKRRRLIIPIDSRLRKAWVIPYKKAWTLNEMVDVTFQVGGELGQRPETLRLLRATADRMGWPYNTLSTLRLYDIVSWWNGAPRSPAVTRTP